ncbi:MAG: GAF domain-containing protein [Anaerolineales bacterium]
MIFGQLASYTLQLALIVLGYALVVTGAGLLLGARVPADNPLLLGVFIFVVALLFNPLQNRLRALVDRVFFRGQRAYRERLAEFSHALTEAGDIPAIVAALHGILSETVRPDPTYIFLTDAVAGEFTAHAADDETGTDLRFEADSPLARTLSAQLQTIDVQPGAGLPGALAEDRARLGVLGAQLFVALATKEHLMGWMALGARRSGARYGADDIQFLEAIADQASVALERAQAVANLERRLNQLNVLTQVSQAVNFTIEFDDLLELIYAQSSRVVDTTNFYIVLHDKGAGTLHYAFVVEQGERLPARENHVWPDSEGLASIVVRTGQSIRTDDYGAECERRSVTPAERPYRAWLGVPLRASERILGALVAASLTSEHTFTADHAQFLASIADQAASAIDKAELYRQAENRAYQLQTLNQIAQTLLATLDLDKVLHLILDNAVGLIACEAGTLFLTDEDTGDYIFRVTSGAGEELLGSRIPAGRGIVGAAATSGKPVVVDNTQDDPRWFQAVDERSGFVTRAALAVPLGIGDRSVGVIEVINKRDGSGFTEDDRALLMAFGGQAVLAIENARLYTMTDQALAARVDELSLLQRIDRELNAGLDIDRVMSITLEQALQNAGANAGLVGFVLTDGVQVVASHGYPEEVVQRFESELLPLDRGPISAALVGDQPFIRHDLFPDPDAVAQAPGAKRQLTIPMRRENRSIGVIVLQSDSEDAFAAEQAEFVRRLADHAAIAVANAALYREVQDANIAKSEFVSFVAHELKTPMTSIKGYADLLAQAAVGPVTDMQAEFLQTIRTNVDRMATLVSDLADIARIESGRMRLEPARFAYRIVVDEVERSSKAAIDDKKQTLTIEMAPDLPEVWADHVRQVQILTNLMSNAHKYTPEEGDLYLRVARAENEWDADGPAEVLHVSVQDTGIGIAPEEQANIFGKFFRSEHRYVREVPGTGLGLNIVKNLVELQGGRAWFESELGVGSTFHITVPVAEAVPDVAAETKTGAPVEA